MTKLERLIGSIAPENTIDPVANKIYGNLNSFTVPTHGLDEWGWDELQEFLDHLFHHMLWHHLPALAKDNPHGSYCGGAVVLYEEYGKQAHSVMLELIHTGAEGGLPGIVDAAARRTIRRQADSVIACRVAEYWEGLSKKEQDAAPDEYFEKYGDLYSTETRRWIWARASVFTNILLQHPHIVDRLRRLPGTGPVSLDDEDYVETAG